MLNCLWRRREAGPVVADLLAGLMRVDARSRVAVMVLVLGPRLRGRLDLAKCLRLAAVGNITAEAAEGLGGSLPGLVGEQGDGVSREARLIETLRRLSVSDGVEPGFRLSLERGGPPAAVRPGLSGATLRWRSAAGGALRRRLEPGVERLKRTGRNPAEVALDVMGYRRMAERLPASPANAGSRRSGCRRCLLQASRSGRPSCARPSCAKRLRGPGGRCFPGR